jgi:hypothetical protein
MNKPWLAAFVLLVCFCACKKENSNNTTLFRPTTAKPVTVVIDQHLSGYTIPHIFQGLSYETGLLIDDSNYLNENNTVLIQLLKNLGRGILRIGGNSSDEIDWGGDDAGSDTLHRKLTKADIDRLAGFAKAIDWPVLFGLNLANNDAAAAADEAAYVHNRLRGNFYAFQTGNEPDFFCTNTHRSFNYKYRDYQSEWDKYYETVKRKAPDASFAGPDVTPFNLRWLGEFAKNEHQRVSLIDGHYYNNGPASNPQIGLGDVLRPNKDMAAYLQGMSVIAANHGLPYRISEGNSIWGQGKPGVSNVFASALWALDFMWSIAENKGQGINFHGGGVRFVYTPINATNGITTVRPAYYAMLAFKYGAVGNKILAPQIINRNSQDNYSVHSSINRDNSTSITFINKELEKDFSFTVQLTQDASNMSISRLSAPSVTSSTDITFAGSTVNEDGTFSPVTTEVYPFNQRTFTIIIPAGSAAVVRVR